MDIARREFIKNSIAAFAIVETIGFSAIASENKNSFREKLIAKGQEVLQSHLYEYNTDEVHMAIEKELKQFAKPYRVSKEIKRFVPICYGKDNRMTLQCAYMLPEDTEYKVIQFNVE